MSRRVPGGFSDMGYLREIHSL
ncbi:hypothetical protein SAM23877_7452 [Streptomyces ambofaciens ATCC 23877]|uniref:Uncharacterized protein n=1 Tax=Streptomyces ambofaciens (strain ATCC 23877 / 3486 / DSM 40053 / JCM 4204 / NBRC 12836 / NRRL B-2516) TaxID=278992 RepID=A0A0K2B5H6_STRA7|nr:hypothetical protein SAM23877_7452 [Streptomyces ambofaciens ATCC 23877]